MSKKGLSVEEKRMKLLELFHESKDFYKLTDLEKIAPKLKGITTQTVKETLQSLVDDNLVSYDKIGVGNFYWSFPSAAGLTLVKDQEKRRLTVEALTKDVERLQTEIEQASVGREETPERHDLLAQIHQVQAKIDLDLIERSKYSNCDPAILAQKEEQIMALQRSAMKWTEKVSTAMIFLCNLHGEDSVAGLKAELGIGEEWDDLSFS